MKFSNREVVPRRKVKREILNFKEIYPISSSILSNNVHDIKHRLAIVPPYNLDLLGRPVRMAIDKFCDKYDITPSYFLISISNLLKTDIDGDAVDVEMIRMCLLMVVLRYNLQSETSIFAEVHDNYVYLLKYAKGRSRTKHKAMRRLQKFTKSIIKDVDNLILYLI